MTDKLNWNREEESDRWDTMDYPDRVHTLLVAGMTRYAVMHCKSVFSQWRVVNPMVKRRIALRIENRVEA